MKLRNTLCSALLLSAMATFSHGEVIDELFSQHLDVTEPAYFFRGQFSQDNEFGSYGMTDIAEGDIRFNLGEAELYWGSLGVAVRAHGIYFVDNPGLDAIPDGLLDAAVVPYYTLRFMNGWSFRLSAAPGMYSDAVEPDFSCPATVNAYFCAAPELSFVIGGTFRPGFDIAFIPNLGLIWEPENSFMRLELGCPYSRIDLFPRHILSFFATAEWRNVTYALEEIDGLPDSLTWDEITVTAGAQLRILGTWFVTGEIGTYLERELSADVATDNAMDISKEPFARVSISSTF